MVAYNVVRFRVKPGMEEEFITAHRMAAANPFTGFLEGALVDTGDRSYCFVGKWVDFEALAIARPEMIALLDSFRHTLEDLGGGLGGTDPVSGSVVVDLPAAG